MLDESTKLLRPYPVACCGNRECTVELERDAYALYDIVERETVVYCDDCARSAITFHADRFKLVA